MSYTVVSESIEEYRHKIATMDRIDYLTLPSIDYYEADPALVFTIPYVTIRCQQRAIRMTIPDEHAIRELIIRDARGVQIVGPGSINTLNLYDCTGFDNTSVTIPVTTLSMDRCDLGHAPIVWPCKVVEMRTYQCRFVLTLDLSEADIIHLTAVRNPCMLYSSTPIIVGPDVWLAGHRGQPTEEFGALRPRRLSLSNIDPHPNLLAFISPNLRDVALHWHGVPWDIPPATLRKLNETRSIVRVMLTGNFTARTYWHLIQAAYERIRPTSTHTPMMLSLPLSTPVDNQPQYLRPLWHPAWYADELVVSYSVDWARTFMLSLNRFYREHGLPPNAIPMELLQEIIRFTVLSAIE